jgi:hypothetical protein
VSYTTSSGISGVTGDDGEFEYQDGDDVTFSIAEAELGTVKGQDEINVFDFVKPTLVSQILHSLDSDKDSSNGYDISYIKVNTTSKVNKLLAYNQQIESFKVDEITAYDQKYKNFLIRHNANIFTVNAATIDDLMAYVQKKINMQTVSKQPIANNAHKIIVGTTVTRLHSLTNEMKAKVQEKYMTLNYAYRVNLAVLNRMDLTVSNEIANVGQIVTDDASALNDAVNDLTNRWTAGVDAALEVAGAALDEQEFSSSLTNLSKIGIDFGSDMYKNGKYSAETKLATTFAYDCVKGKKNDTCLIDGLKNGLSFYAKHVLKEESPVVDDTIDIGFDTLKMWNECEWGDVKTLLQKGKEYKCFKEVVKTGFKNSLKLVTRV